MSRILWRTNSSGKRSGAFTTPSSPTRMQLFRRPPLARPICSSCSISLTKPKVQMGLANGGRLNNCILVGEAHLLELLDLLDEAEGARRGDLAAERLRVGEAEGVLLAPDGRWVVEDVVHLEAVGRLDRDALVRGVIGADGVALVDDE